MNINPENERIIKKQLAAFQVFFNEIDANPEKLGDLGTVAAFQKCCMQMTQLSQFMINDIVTLASKDRTEQFNKEHKDDTPPIEDKIDWDNFG